MSHCVKLKSSKMLIQPYLLQTLEQCDSSLVKDLGLIKEEHVLINKSHSNEPSKYSELRDELDLNLKVSKIFYEI